MSAQPKGGLRRRAVIGAIGAVVAVVVVALSGQMVDGNEVAPGEVGVFRVVNGLPAFLYPLLWPTMQLGNLVVLPAAAVVAAAFRKWWLALACLALVPLKLFATKTVKDNFFRERPTAVIDDVVRRGDVSSSGQAFVSGHALVVAALAVVAYRYLGRRARIAVWVAVGCVVVGRVYVGAHMPLDVIAGAALGAGIGGVVSILLPDPKRATEEVPERR